MKLEAYVIEEEGKILKIKEDGPSIRWNQVDEDSDPSSYAQVSADDPQLTQEIIEIDPSLDAYAVEVTISIC